MWQEASGEIFNAVIAQLQAALSEEFPSKGEDFALHFAKYGLAMNEWRKKDRSILSWAYSQQGDKDALCQEQAPEAQKKWEQFWKDESVRQDKFDLDEEEWQQVFNLMKKFFRKLGDDLEQFAKDHIDQPMADEIRGLPVEGFDDVPREIILREAVDKAKGPQQSAPFCLKLSQDEIISGKVNLSSLLRMVKYWRIDSSVLKDHCQDLCNDAFMLHNAAMQERIQMLFNENPGLRPTVSVSAPEKLNDVKTYFPCGAVKSHHDEIGVALLVASQNGEINLEQTRRFEIPSGSTLSVETVEGLIDQMMAVYFQRLLNRKDLLQPPVQIH